MRETWLGNMPVSSFASRRAVNTMSGSSSSALPPGTFVSKGLIPPFRSPIGIPGRQISEACVLMAADRLVRNTQSSLVTGSRTSATSCQGGKHKPVRLGRGRPGKGCKPRPHVLSLQICQWMAALHSPCDSRRASAPATRPKRTKRGLRPWPSVDDDETFFSFPSFDSGCTCSRPINGAGPRACAPRCRAPHQ